MRKPNNPRTFAETVSLGCWRTEYGGNAQHADLHVDVVFSEGRIGGDMTAEDCPVFFRLSLRRAEIWVRHDLLEEIQIVKSSVMREPVASGRRQITRESKGRVGGDAALKLDDGGLRLGLGAEASGSVEVTKRLEFDQEVPQMRIQQRLTEDGWALRIESNFDERLDGQPWDALTPVMKLRNTNIDRVRGEPPEVTVEVRCRREDLEIRDIELRGKKFPAWATLSSTKQLMVEQYIKQELVRSGLHCGDLGDKFAILILADAIPEAE
jgi:hypothetical protein